MRFGWQMIKNFGNISLMKILLLAVLAVLAVSCAPSERLVSEIPRFAGVYARITIEGTDSITLFTQMTLSMREKASSHGFVFRAYNTGSTSVNALWFRIAGQQAQSYFRADEVRDNDKKNRVVLTLLTDPNPPPLPEIFNDSLVLLLSDLSDRLNLPPTRFKVELK